MCTHQSRRGGSRCCTCVTQRRRSVQSACIARPPVSRRRVACSVVSMALIFAWNRQTELTCSAESPVHRLTCLQDFKDLFSTLMVSLPLNSHRVRFSRHEHSFTTDEALTNLGSLKFSQSNRMPDPKDPTRIVTTTTTTTFSMAKEMARSVCQRFLDARFVESPIPPRAWQSGLGMRCSSWPRRREVPSRRATVVRLS